MALGGEHIEQRRAVHVDADGAELVGDDAITQPRRLERAVLVGAVEEAHHRAPPAPVRRAEALDAPALLVDQHRRVAANRAAQRRGQAAELRRARDVAGEQDEAPRIGVAEEGGFRRAELRAGRPEDRRSRRHA